MSNFKLSQPCFVDVHFLKFQIFSLTYYLYKGHLYLSGLSVKAVLNIVYKKMQDLPKMPANSSPPVARSGAGDISERELSRERYNLQTTPPA